MEPRGDITTVLDQVSRDEQDNILFPLDTTTTQFATDPYRRFHPFSMSIQEHIYRGTAEWGGRFTFDLGSVGAGDLLQSVLVQVKLQHWLPDTILEGLRSGLYIYQDPATATRWTKNLGTIMIAKAELEVGDQILETVDGDFATVFSELFPDINTQLGIATDALGTQTSADFPCGPKGYITAILPFFFQRTRLKETFALLSIKEGTARINIQFRPFADLIAGANSPLGKTFTFLNTTTSQTFSYTVPELVPQPQDVRLITYTALLNGTLRQAYLRQPHEMLYRSVQTFRFTEPTKYKVAKPASDSVLIQLPLEANGPIEEILWVLRRTGSAKKNEWTNFSAIIEEEYDPVYNPYRGLVKHAIIQANGQDLINATADYFRAHIAEKHRGGIVAYNSYIYGYSFARHPSEHQPSGTINASRLNSLRLSLEVEQPANDDWEVIVFCMGLNWMRFENGLVNRLYAD